VIASLDAACDCVGVKCFFGNIWMAIVRSSRCRLGAFKYLLKRWNRNKMKELEGAESNKEAE